LIDRQEVLYNGYYGGHGFKYQIVIGPSGLIEDCSGPYAGSLSDSDMVTRSDLSERLGEFGVVPTEGREPIKLGVYGDAGYGQVNHVERPFSSVRITPMEENYNALMSRVRSQVENAIGLVTQQFPALDMTRWERSGSTNITMRYLVAVILRNMLTCVQGGNQVSIFFGEKPPSLQEFARPSDRINPRIAELMQLVAEAEY